ncbi:B12-binding domain-containing radical SAM protein [Micromonospora sp. CPCC 206061]|uniref:B12-binding domain-containing radical SAM protein n=1 Tax=Micromonospora sp. CPCC 206061 TaxID=3122410 RepID=UPI002FF2F80F
MDLLLLLPPMSEATFFPYLSLPYLAGHVRRSGYSAHQVDLGIEMIHRLLDGPALTHEVRGLDEAHDVHSWYQAAVADAALQFRGELRDFVLRKHPAHTLGATRAVELARRSTRLILQRSALSRVWDAFDALDEEALRLSEAEVGSLDVATRTLRDLLTDALDQSVPRAVGISVPFFSQLLPALLIALWVRRLSPGVRICLGGQQVMLRHDDLAGMASVRTAVDALCITAGEEPLERWLAHLTGTAVRHDVPGMRWVSTGGATAPGRAPTLHFKDLGAPDYDGLKVLSYLTESAAVSVVSCVGCYWGRCIFCSYGNRSLDHGAYQQASPGQLADAICETVRSTGIRFVTIVDENSNLRLVVKAMRLVRGRGLEVHFNTRNRLEPVLLDPNFCKELAELGCDGMAIGYEGVSQRLLDKLDKGVEAADFQTIMDNLAAVNIRINFSIMGGLLDETEDEHEASVRFLERNRGRFGVDVVELLIAEPGTRLSADPRDFGVVLDASARFADNRELNYLSGRVGVRHAVIGGLRRTDALQRVKATVSRISTIIGAPAESAAEPLAALRPHPWIRSAPNRLSPDATVLLVADPIREKVYQLPKRHVSQAVERGGVLIANTEPGRSLLGQLLAADLGVVADEQIPNVGLQCEGVAWCT